MFNQKKFIEEINKGVKCDKKCPVHKLFTHNTCCCCPALKDSPYYQDYLKNKTDKQIANDVKEMLEEIGEEYANK